MTQEQPQPSRRFSVAPMMEWTDRHCRVFHRHLTRHALLYTEMVTAEAIRHGDRDRLLGYSAGEHPLALQLGGSEPEVMAEAARVAEDWGYAEVNVNVGCPSDRVQSGAFGACLMREPETVGRVVEAMARAVSIPVTVKCRIGVDDQDPEIALDALVDAVSSAGCGSVTVHARKAWLQGLSPKENRDVPPLDYDRVYRLKIARPDLEVVINGGIADLDEAEAHLTRVDGAMIGRAAYQSPWMLREVDARLFGVSVPQEPDRWEIVRAMSEYAERMAAERGTPVRSIAKHMMGLFQGLPGARAWRRYLSENMHASDAGPEVLIQAAAQVRSDSRAAA
ncbi:MAG: tRNA dihydrouridine(20/20a) synthase DusA [Alphaproteobacteria bacterium]|nr:tRNA dihydrouridine(20/20a) synthase DusA [Alphaproteobacteria bacterium]